MFNIFGVCSTLPLSPLPWTRVPNPPSHPPLPPRCSAIWLVRDNSRQTASWSSQSSKGKGKGREKPEESPLSGLRGRWRQGVPHEVRQTRNPDEVRVGATNKMTRLQGALAVLGEAALTKVQVQAVVPLVAEQAAQTQKFIETETGARTRRNCRKAEERLSRLRLEVDRPAPPVSDPSLDDQSLRRRNLNGVAISPSRSWEMVRGSVGCRVGKQATRTTSLFEERAIRNSRCSQG